MDLGTVPKSVADLSHWLYQYARPLGLLGYASEEQTMRSAVQPALALPALLGSAPTGTCLEIGTGSGAIGLTLAVGYPAAHFTLADRRERVVAHIDLACARIGIRNAVSANIDISVSGPSGTWDGVLFRAVAMPERALSMAAHNARRWICAWHSPNVAQYDTPPTGFRLAARVPTSDARLIATLYARVSPPWPVPSANLTPGGK